MLKMEGITRRWVGVVVAALTAIALVACGDAGSDAAEEAGGASTTAPEAATEVDADAEAEENAEAQETVDDSEPSGTGVELTAEDGWLELHDLDIPGPGEGWISIEGETVELDVECTVDSIFAEADWMLFTFGGTASGVLADGREIGLIFERRIVSVEEAELGYGPQESGIITVSVLIDDGLSNSSNITTPSDADPDGTQLPVVRVDESGAFTIVENLEAMPSHDQALTGPTEIAGRCQDSWSA